MAGCNHMRWFMAGTMEIGEAVARHKAAAEKRPAAEGGTDKAVPGVANRELAGAMFEAHLSKDGLEGYLRGEVGSPRISKPLLTGKLGLSSSDPSAGPCRS